MNKNNTALFIFLFLPFSLFAQDQRPVKIKHAEPLYTDLIRDLGARKGERELNLGWGMTNKTGSELHSGFVEYEFCPVNRLGLEVEMPFSFYSTKKEKEGSYSTLHGIKLASQYTFLVSGKRQLSAAVGYIHEVEFTGNSLNPFLAIAKRWGRAFHSMICAGPVFEFHTGHPKQLFQSNISFHYVPDKGSAFVGIEVNESWSDSPHELWLRPQLKLKLTANSSLGLVSSIPVCGTANGVGFLFRFIYEAPRKN